MKALLPLALLLIIACSALAVPVNPDSPNGVAATLIGGQTIWVLCANGAEYVWSWNDTEWTFIGDNLPVPVDQIAEWSRYIIITVDGQMYGGDSASGWTQLPTVPCLDTVAQDTQDLGNLKARFR